MKGMQEALDKKLSQRKIIKSRNLTSEDFESWWSKQQKPFNQSVASGMNEFIKSYCEKAWEAAIGK